MPLTRQQEQFSIAWVRSVASVAGYAVEEIRVDIDSVDLTIVQVGVGEEYPLIEGLKIQLKCTYAHAPKEDGLHYPLKIKNYNDLRRDCLNPRILVVLHVPEKAEQWLKHSHDTLSLYHCAYWMSLNGMPVTENSDTVSVTIPLEQRFTVDALRLLMTALAKGERL